MNQLQRETLARVRTLSKETPDGWVRAGLLGAAATLRQLEAAGVIESREAPLGSAVLNVSVKYVRAVGDGVDQAAAGVDTVFDLFGPAVG